MRTNTKILFVVGAALATATCLGCGAAADSADQPFAESQSALTVVRTPYGQDDRGYTGDGDWSWWHWKGECALNEFVVGASRVLNANPNSGALHGILCQQANGDGTPETRTLDISSSDDRIYNDNNWDWHPGYYKAECAANEMVTGISQSSDYSGGIHNVRCGFANSVISYTKNCRRVEISDNYIPPNIWDPGYAQNDCRSGDVVRGISTYPYDGQIRAILCCGAQPYIP